MPVNKTHKQNKKLKRKLTKKSKKTLLKKNKTLKGTRLLIKTPPKL